MKKVYIILFVVMWVVVCLVSIPHALTKGVEVITEGAVKFTQEIKWHFDALRKGEKSTFAISKKVLWMAIIEIVITIIYFIIK